MPRSTLDPKLDVVFSMLFGQERNRDLLLSLLNAVLEPPVAITEVEVLPERPERLEVDDKGVVLDVRARLASGEQIDVEMQSQRRAAERERALYYWARLYAGQLARGDDYAELHRCAVIVIANFRMLVSPRFHSIFRARALATDEQLTEHLELHVLELPKLELGRARNEGRAALLWGKFLTAETDAELEHLAMEEPALKRAKEALETLSADPQARIIAERRETGLLLYKADLAAARRQARAEGEAIGKAKGEAIGKAKGTADAILTVLKSRGVAVNDVERERISTCVNLQLLEGWLSRAASVASVGELFGA